MPRGWGKLTIEIGTFIKHRKVKGTFLYRMFVYHDKQKISLKKSYFVLFQSFQYFSYCEYFT